jgi:hypothetical protein
MKTGSSASSGHALAMKFPAMASAETREDIEDVKGYKMARNWSKSGGGQSYEHIGLLNQSTIMFDVHSFDHQNLQTWS